MTIDTSLSILDFLQKDASRHLFETRTMIFEDQGEVIYSYFLGICWRRTFRIRANQLQ